MTLKKWQLTKSIDVSPSSWFPLEKRSYILPDGREVNDFYVTTLADSVHVISLTKQGQVVLIRMYKQGLDEIVISFPAGRFEKQKHQSFIDCAVQEFEEEAGIVVKPQHLTKLGSLSLMNTKASEKAHYFFTFGVEFNSRQKLDEFEEIEVLLMTPKEIDQAIIEGKIWDAPCIAGWQLAKLKFPKLLTS